MKMSIGPRLADEYGKYADMVEETSPSDMVFRCMQYVGFKIVLFAIHIVNHHHQRQHQYHPQQSLSSFLSFVFSRSLSLLWLHFPLHLWFTLYVYVAVCGAACSVVRFFVFLPCIEARFFRVFFTMCRSCTHNTNTYSTYEHICPSCVLIL